MEKYNLNDTWKYCLQMWKWIGKEWEKDNHSSILLLKDRWCRKHGFKYIEADCFFCHYVETHAGDGCKKCPGRKVDKSFQCETLEYNYATQPIKFYKMIRKLNRIRLEKRSKK